MKIQIDNVTKTFNSREVVRGLSFKVSPGQIVGLLGPNGAGKTTTLRMILDILRPDHGTITFDDAALNRHVRYKIGYLPEERGLYQKYSVMDVLLYFGRLKNLGARKSHIEAIRLLDNFQMIDYVHEPVGHLSRGIQQKLQFIVSLVHNPDILIMDEPMAGLDPLNQQMIKQKLIALREEGKTILLSTHQLSEAEALCDFFMIIDQGRTVLKGSLEKIRQNFFQNMIVVETRQDSKLLKNLPGVHDMDVQDSLIYLYLDEKAPAKEVMRDIIQRVDVLRIETHKPSLNDIFLQTIKSGAK